MYSLSQLLPNKNFERVKFGKTAQPPFEWTEQCEQSFDALKDALTSAPVLAYPDYSKPFILEMDASLKGLGAVLSQRGDGSEIW